MKVHRIKDWNTHFENAQSRKLVRGMEWFPVPTKHDGKGFRRLMRQPDGVALYGAWILIAAVAAKSPVRGVLVDSDGALSAEDISLKTDAPSDLIERALTVLTDNIQWIEVVEIESVHALMSEHQRPPTVGEQWESSGSGDDRRGSTGQDRTGQNRTLSPVPVPVPGPASGNGLEGHPGQTGSGARSSEGAKPGSLAAVTPELLSDTAELWRWFEAQAKRKSPWFAKTDDGWRECVATAEQVRGGSKPAAWFVKLAKSDQRKLSDDARDAGLKRIIAFNNDLAKRKASRHCAKLPAATREPATAEAAP